MSYCYFLHIVDNYTHLGCYTHFLAAVFSYLLQVPFVILMKKVKVADASYPHSMVSGMKTVYSQDSNKGLSLEFLEGYQV